jgi:hypothetical protein
VEALEDHDRELSPRKLPLLPTELAEWAPSADSLYLSGTILFVDDDWIASYDELRPQVGLAVALGDTDRAVPAREVSWRVVKGGY